MKLLSQESNSSSLYILPNELLFHLLSYLNPRQRVSVAEIDTLFYELAKDGLYWKKKYQQHFPQLFLSKHNHADIDWYQMFLQTYEIQYAALNAQQKKLINLIKEGKASDAFSKAELKDTLDEPLLQQIYAWAKANDEQAAFDVCYHCVRLLYTSSRENSIAQDFNILLYWALHCKQPKAEIEGLFAQGADINYEFKEEGLPLHLAAKLGLLEIVSLLMANDKVDINAECLNGITPLHLAAKGGHLPVVNALLAHPKIEVNAAGNGGLTPLYGAIEAGHLDIVKALLAQRADIHAQYLDEMTPLHCAAQKGCLEMVKILIEQGAETDATYSSNQLSLEILTRHRPGSEKRLQKLIQEKTKSSISSSFTLFAPSSFHTKLNLTAREIAELYGYTQIVAYIDAAKEEKDKKEKCPAFSK